MLDTQDQLHRLRERLALKVGSFRKQEAIQPPIARKPADEMESGQIVRTSLGEHFELVHLFPGHRPHGSADVGALLELPSDLLLRLGDGVIPACPPERWAFLDTETTGLAGGAGTFAFLIGLGRITTAGFEVRQFFMRNPGEEHSMLAGMGDFLSSFDVLITFNGRSYDLPLIETRRVLARQPNPFTRLPHVDLLYGARRLWKLRLQSCRLTHLEEQILGYERTDDVPGHLIPDLYFDYVRGAPARRLQPIFRHNALDLLTLACLTAVVPVAFLPGRNQVLRHGTDLIGVARWFQKAQKDQALALLKEAIRLGLPDHLLFRSMWEAAMLEKRLGRPEAALESLHDLAECRNPYRVRALEELAKYHERVRKDFASALDYTEQALRCQRTEALLVRQARLLDRCAQAALTSVQ